MKKVLLISLVLFFSPFFAHAQSVDILWQGETYTPPFYKGLPLWSNQSEVTFAAITTGLGDPATLNYRWIRNGTVLGLVSGVGKKSLSFLDTVFSKPVIVEVEVLDAQGKLLASNEITLVPRASELLIYEDNPLYGYMFHREASSGYKLEKAEATFAAFPLFFSVAARKYPGLSYVWRANAREAGREESVTFRTPEGVSGRSSVSIRASNEYFLRQNVDKSFLIQFGEQ